MKQIILPSDFSDNSWRAMCFAANVFHSTPCKFHIVNTVPIQPSFPKVDGSLLIDSRIKESEEGLEKLLARFKELDHHSHSDFETKSYQGSLINSIIGLEETMAGNTTIVMGTRGASGLGKLFFGTQSTEAIKKCNSPIICVPAKSNLAIPKNIMFAMDDLLISSQNEIQPLLDLAHANTSKIATVHINDILLSSDEKTPKEIVTDYYLKKFEHSYHNLSGKDVEDELTRFAESNAIDLIALIKRNKGFWENLFQSSLTETMAFHSEIPLFIMREY